MNVEGIKPSKKYANGTIHENASGKFQVLDRFLDEDGKTIIIKIQWIETGTVEVNKEVNISASIWKFQKSRGIIDSPTYLPPIDAVSLSDIKDSIEHLSQHLKEANQGRIDFQTRIQETNMILTQQQIVIGQLLEMVTANQDTVKQLVEKSNTINKLIDKL
jgi:uncharacterized coiled-coil protein SlyX